LKGKKKCASCAMSPVSKEQLKKLQEMMKKRAKPEDCPYLPVCEKKVLENEFQILCKDQEVSREIISLHITGRHAWELCEAFVKKKREKEGKRPKEWNK